MENSQRKANARNGFILKLQLMFLSNKLRSARMIISNFLMMENMFEIENLFLNKIKWSLRWHCNEYGILWLVSSFTLSRYFRWLGIKMKSHNVSSGNQCGNQTYSMKSINFEYNAKNMDPLTVLSAIASSFSRFVNWPDSIRHSIENNNNKKVMRQVNRLIDTTIRFYLTRMTSTRAHTHTGQPSWIQEAHCILINRYKTEFELYK